MKTDNIILITLLLLLSFSCTVEKRLYNNGYHVSWKKNADKLSSTQEIDKPIRSYSNNASAFKNNTHVDKLPIRSINRSPISINRKIIDIEKNTLLDSECDELMYRNGEIENVIVEEVTKNEIKYRMCNNQEGPLFIIGKSELFMIKYKNGTKTVLNEHNEKKESDKKDNEVEDETEKQEASDQDTETEKTTHPLAIWGFILSILGLFVPYVGALVCWTGLYLSLKALKSIKENPNKYKGKGLARAGQIIGWMG